MRWIFVDKFIEMEPGKSAVGIRNFSRSEMFFMDHFPGFPVVPGVLHAEMIAQTGGKCIMAARPDVLPILGSIKSAKFYSRIVPGDQAVIKVEVASRKDYSIVKGQIEVRGIRVSAAEVMLVHIALSNNLVSRAGNDDILDEWRTAKANE